MEWTSTIQSGIIIVSKSKPFESILAGDLNCKRLQRVCFEMLFVAMVIIVSTFHHTLKYTYNE